MKVSKTAQTGVDLKDFIKFMQLSSLASRHRALVTHAYSVTLVSRDLKTSRDDGDQQSGDARLVCSVRCDVSSYRGFCCL